MVVLQDGVAMLWDLAEGKRLYSLDAGDIIHALCFSPNRYWLCAATQSCIKVGSSTTSFWSNELPDGHCPHSSCYHHRTLSVSMTSSLSRLGPSASFAPASGCLLTWSINEHLW